MSSSCALGRALPSPAVPLGPSANERLRTTMQDRSRRSIWLLSGQSYTPMDAGVRRCMRLCLGRGWLFSRLPRKVAGELRSDRPNAQPGPGHSVKATMCTLPDGDSRPTTPHRVDGGDRTCRDTTSRWVMSSSERTRTYPPNARSWAVTTGGRRSSVSRRSGDRGGYCGGRPGGGVLWSLTTADASSCKSCVPGCRRSGDGLRAPTAVSQGSTIAPV